MDQLKLLRREKKLRREEEERRQHRAALAAPSASTNNGTRPGPDPAAARCSSNNNEARQSAHTTAANTTQQVESQKKKQAPAVSTLPLSSESPPSPSHVTRKRPRASEDPPENRVREPAVTSHKEAQAPLFSLGRASPPKEVLDKHAYASPASSVSFSQSPSKEVRKPVALALAPPPAPPQTARATTKRAPTLYRNFGARDSSSSEEEDEDLFAFAQALEAKKRLPAGTTTVVAAADTTTKDIAKSTTGVVARETTKPSSSIPLLRNNGNYNGRTEDKEDIVQASRRLEAHRNQQQQMDAARNNDDDDDDGSIGTPTPTKPDKPSTPRNPIARAKENSKPFYQVSPPTAIDGGNGDSLFDSEEDEEEEEEDVDEQVAPGKKKKRSAMERPKIKRGHNNNNKPRDRTTTNASLPTAEDVLDKDTAALQAELKPDFERPKFGPFAFEPLRMIAAAPCVSEERPAVGVMGPDAGAVGDDQDTMEEAQVPASINRFLPNYQQEGIRFLYNLVSSKRGGILGDDMGVGAFCFCVFMRTIVLCGMVAMVTAHDRGR